MKFKKIIKNTIIFATMMLVIGVYTAPVISKAGDDVWYGASFDFDGDTYYTDRKSKNTSSSVWMSCTDKDIDGSYYYAKVYALNSAGTRIDVSHGYEYYFDVNDSHNMLNWVYEEHYNMTCVRCEGYSVDDYLGVLPYLSESAAVDERAGGSHTRDFGEEESRKVLILRSTGVGGREAEADVCAQGRGGANPEPDRGATPSGGRTERPEEVSGGTAKMSAAFSSERGGSDGEL